MEQNKKEQIKRNSTKNLVSVGMFAAVLAVLAQLSIPMPTGVPITLQTFAVALTAYVLGAKLGLAAVFIYVLVGAVGVPVFANFNGGIGALTGMTGGFIWGFFAMAFLCGAGMEQNKKVLLPVMSAAGLLICHLIGIIQFMLITDMTFAAAAAAVSIPYLLKDIISVAAAYVLAVTLRRALRTAGMAAA